MTREEDIKQAADNYADSCVALKFTTKHEELKHTDIVAAFRAGAEFADNHPNLRIEVDDIDKAYQETAIKEVMSTYNKYLLKKFTDKACELLCKVNYTETFVNNFRKEMLEYGSN